MAAAILLTHSLLPKTPQTANTLGPLSAPTNAILKGAMITPSFILFSLAHSFMPALKVSALASGAFSIQFIIADKI